MAAIAATLAVSTGQFPHSSTHHLIIVGGPFFHTKPKLERYKNLVLEGELGTPISMGNYRGLGQITH